MSKTTDQGAKPTKTETKAAVAAPSPRKKSASVPARSPVPKKAKATQVAKKATEPALDRRSGGKKQPIVAAKKPGSPKEKLVRDSFTMPPQDFALIAALKRRALIFKRPTKKSELLRAGLHALHALSAPALRSALDALTPLKAGRPKGQPS